MSTELLMTTEGYEALKKELNELKLNNKGFFKQIKSKFK
mgnify:CR=1 FL=1